MEEECGFPTPEARYKRDDDSLVVMDEETGFNGAVNRGPAAFVDFLKQFDSAFGINIQRLLGADVEGGRS